MAPPGRKPTPIADRLFARIEVDDATGCWNWLGCKDRRGYGHINVGTKRENRVAGTHRVCYEINEGPIPEGLHLDHLCRNTSCCNPDPHLEPVTIQENLLRGETPSNAYREATHCIHGHEFTEANTYRTEKGRYCRACRRRRNNESNARKKAIA